jgi:hypothetical protein
LLLGPLAAYNFAAIALPAAAALSAYRLCFCLTGQRWPSFIGGYLFGFSGYLLGQEEGHMQMTSVFLLPFIALTVLRFLRRELDQRRLLVRLGPLLGAQFWLSTELFVTASLALVVALLATYASVHDLRPRFRPLVVAVTGSYLVALLLAAPILYYSVSQLHNPPANMPSDFPTDLLNLIVPTGLALLGSRGATAVWHFTAGNAESGGYLGLPVVAMIAAFAASRWRSRSGGLLLLLFGVALVASYGTSLQLNGHRLIGLPWTWLTYTIPLDNVLPARLSVYATLTAAVISAIWLATQTEPLRRIVLPVLAIAALLPALGHGYWKTVPSQPGFFTASQYRSCLPPQANVLTIPYNQWGTSLLSQAEDSFRFRLAGGYVTDQWPHSYTSFTATFVSLESDEPQPTASTAQIVAFAHAKRVSDITVAQDAGYNGWARTLARRIHPRSLGGVWLFPLTPAATLASTCPGS